MPKQFIGFINGRYAPPNPPENTIPAILLTGDVMLVDDDTIEIRKPPERDLLDIVYKEKKIQLDPNHGSPVLKFIQGWTAINPNPVTEAVHGYSVYKVT